MIFNANKLENAQRLGLILDDGTLAVKFYLESYVSSNTSYNYKNLNDDIAHQRSLRNRNLDGVFKALDRNNMNAIKDFQIFDLSACYALARNILKIDGCTGDQNINFNDNRPGVLINNLRIVRNSFAKSDKFKLEYDKYEEYSGVIKNCIEHLCSSDPIIRDDLLRKLDHHIKTNDRKELFKSKVNSNFSDFENSSLYYKFCTYLFFSSLFVFYFLIIPCIYNKFIRFFVLASFCLIFYLYFFEYNFVYSFVQYILLFSKYFFFLFLLLVIIKVIIKIIWRQLRKIR